MVMHLALNMIDAPNALLTEGLDREKEATNKHGGDRYTTVSFLLSLCWYSVQYCTIRKLLSVAEVEAEVIQTA